mgnify:CR=1 FL=1
MNRFTMDRIWTTKTLSPWILSLVLLWWTSCYNSGRVTFDFSDFSCIQKPYEAAIVYNSQTIMQDSPITTDRSMQPIWSGATQYSSGTRIANPITYKGYSWDQHWAMPTTTILGCKCYQTGSNRSDCIKMPVCGVVLLRPALISKTNFVCTT